MFFSKTAKTKKKKSENFRKSYLCADLHPYNTQSCSKKKIPYTVNTHNKTSEQYRRVGVFYILLHIFYVFIDLRSKKMTHLDVLLNIFSGADLVSVGDYSETKFLSETIKILHGKSLNFWVGLKKSDRGNIFYHVTLSNEITCYVKKKSILYT